jgi:putative transposase
MEIVWRCLFLYFKYPLSFRQVAEMMRERGVTLSHMSVFRWVIKFGPELEAKFRKHKQPVNSSWRIDETYIRIKAKDRYLYRAVDKFGNSIDFLLTAKRDLKAAKRFLKKSIRSHGLPAKANIDKSGANIAAMKEVNKENRDRIEVRKSKFLNNMVEQDHRFIKKRIRSMLGFKTFHSARIILAGVEVLHMIFKNQSGYLPLFHRDPINAYWALVSS